MSEQLLRDIRGLADYAIEVSRDYGGATVRIREALEATEASPPSSGGRGLDVAGLRRILGQLPGDMLVVWQLDDEGNGFASAWAETGIARCDRGGWEGVADEDRRPGDVDALFIGPEWQ